MTSPKPTTPEALAANATARARHAATADHRLFVGTLPTGVPILVRVYADSAEVAFKHDDRWGLPVGLEEEK